MATSISVSPVTRVEGHLDIEVTVDAVNGVQQVVAAKSMGTMFRGFEIILAGRDPRDAIHITQRMCGVCSSSHGMASAMTLEAAFGLPPTDNGRIMRNLVLGADFLQSHILHFYHLSALDFIDTTGILDMSPWVPRFTTPDMVKGTTAANLVSHYVQALKIRRKAHQMGAIFGGKLPGATTFVAGGCSDVVTPQKISDFRALLTDVAWFVRNIYIPDVEAVAAAFPQYASIGKGWGNLLSYGGFDLDAGGVKKLFRSGRLTKNVLGTLKPQAITEYVAHSKYTAESGNLNPNDGVTEPQGSKTDAYSWIKSPRYVQRVHEVGPLARMWVNGDYRKGISVIDRIAARAWESRRIAEHMTEWLDQLDPEAATQGPVPVPVPATAAGIGLTEAPRGSVGHWMQLADAKITRYQVISPTSWNASPMDDFGQPGPIEQALIGTPVADLTQPIELLRVVHSFDPCLACSVHVVRPK